MAIRSLAPACCARLRRRCSSAGRSVVEAGAVPAVAALEVLELPGLDHSLEAPGDVAASLRALATVTDAVAAFLARPEVSPPHPRP